VLLISLAKWASPQAAEEAWNAANVHALVIVIIF
jgi:hypothetical protein